MPFTARQGQGQGAVSKPCGHTLGHLGLPPIPTLQRRRDAEMRGDFSPCHWPVGRADLCSLMPTPPSKGGGSLSPEWHVTGDTEPPASPVIWPCPAPATFPGTRPTNPPSAQMPFSLLPAPPEHPSPAGQGTRFPRRQQLWDLAPAPLPSFLTSLLQALGIGEPLVPPNSALCSPSRLLRMQPLLSATPAAPLCLVNLTVSTAPAQASPHP